MNSRQYAVAFFLGLLSISSSAEKEKCYTDKDGKKVCEKCGTNSECGGNKKPAPSDPYNRKDSLSAKEAKRKDFSSNASDLHSERKASDKALIKDRSSDFEPDMKR